MQHVLRCWERQSDGSEYKKTLRPDPAGELTALPANTLVGGEGLTAPPQEPHHRSRSSGLASPTPTPKLVLTPLLGIDKKFVPVRVKLRKDP